MHCFDLSFVKIISGNFFCNIDLNESTLPFRYYSAIYARETDEFSSRRHRTGGRHCHHRRRCCHRSVAQALL